MSGFAELQTRALRLYAEGRHAEVLELSRQNLPRFPEHEHRLRFWIAGMLTLLERRDEAVSTLRDGLSKGLWWNPAQFRNDSDFASLLEYAGFAELLVQCQLALEMARLESQPKLRVYPGGTASPPLLVALHMRGSNAADSAPHWETATRQGWTVALPQSSQVFSLNGYCWDDPALVEREIGDVHNLLATQNPYDASRVVYGGASQGGLAAAYLALKNAARGFVAVVPAFGSRVSGFGWEGLLEGAAAGGVRGVVVTGEQDWALEPTQNAVKKMREAGLSVGLEVVPGLGHDYPPEMAERLKRALEFVTDSR